MSQSPLRATRERPTQVVRVPRQRQSYPAPSDVARGSRARKAMVLPAAICGVATLAGAATLGAVAVNQGRHTTHEIHQVDRSGSLVADPAALEAGTVDLGRVRSGFEQQYGGRLDNLVTAAFRNSAPGQGHPAGTVVFVGATIDTAGDPSDFVGEIRRAATAEGSQAQQVDAGRDARGACVSTQAGASTCAWSTGDSVGQLIATGNGWSVSDLAQAMRTLRADAETER